MSAYKMAKIIRAAYHKSTPTVRCDEDFQMPYWWNEDIQTNILEVKKREEGFNEKQETMIFASSINVPTKKQSRICLKRSELQK